MEVYSSSLELFNFVIYISLIKIFKRIKTIEAQIKFETLIEILLLQKTSF